jgi:hypothetical protein
MPSSDTASFSSEVIAPITPQSRAAGSQPITVTPSSSKQVLEPDLVHDTLDLDNNDKDEVVVVEYQESPGKSKENTLAAGVKGEPLEEVLSLSIRDDSGLELSGGNANDKDAEENKVETDLVSRSRDGTLHKVSKIICEVRTKLAESETERLKLEESLHQYIVVLEGKLKREQLARQFAERRLAVTSQGVPSEVQQRIAELEKHNAELEKHIANLEKQLGGT